MRHASYGGVVSRDSPPHHNPIGSHASDCASANHGIWHADRPDYAIDPSRIALAGVSNGGGYALGFGYANRDVFSRVISWSPAITPIESKREANRLGLAPTQRHGSPPIFIGQGTNDAEVAITDTRTVVAWLRHDGYSVTFVEDSGRHYLTKGRAIAAFQWLATSWQ